MHDKVCIQQQLDCQPSQPRMPPTPQNIPKLLQNSQTILDIYQQSWPVLQPGQDSEPPREASSFSAAPEARQAAEQAGGLPAHADKSATTSTEPPKAATETGTPGQVTGQKRRRQGPVRVRVDQFPRGSSLMNELMAGVISGISGSQVLSNRLFQVCPACVPRIKPCVLLPAAVPRAACACVTTGPKGDLLGLGSIAWQSLMRHEQRLCSKMLTADSAQANFHTTLSGDAMVTLLYHKKLDAAWRDAAQQLRSALASSCPSFQSAAAPQSLADGHTPPEPAAGQPKTAADPSAQQQGWGSGPQEGQADSTAADTPPPPSTAANKDSLDQLDESPLPGLMGRSRGMRITLGRDFVTEQLPLGQRHLSYRCGRSLAGLRAATLGHVQLLLSRGGYRVSQDRGLQLPEQASHHDVALPFTG